MLSDPEGDDVAKSQGPQAQQPTQIPEPDLIPQLILRDLRRVLAAGLTERDVRLILRAQLLSRSGQPRCRDLEVKEHVYGRIRYDREVPASGMGPLPVPRDELQCPLMERAERGDTLVPCSQAQKALPPSALAAPIATADPAVDPAQAEALLLLRNANILNEALPCHLIDRLITPLDWKLGPAALLNQALSQAPGPPESPAAAPGTPDDLVRLTGLRQRAETAGFEAHREQLRWLLATERLTLDGLVQLAAQLLIVTDAGWLPCRDDSSRVFTPAPEDAETGYLVARRLRCPLELRARQGDTTVPCAQAQSLLPKGSVPSEPAGLPRSWPGEDDLPGGPKDPVRTLTLRPCLLLGQVLAHTLYPLARRLTAPPPMARSETKSGAERRPAQATPNTTAAKTPQATELDVTPTT